MIELYAIILEWVVRIIYIISFAIIIYTIAYNFKFVFETKKLKIENRDEYELKKKACSDITKSNIIIAVGIFILAFYLSLIGPHREILVVS